MSATYKRIYRSTDQKMLGGVCAGLGEYLEIDPTLVRIGFVVGSLLGWLPVIVLAYLFMWIIVPEKTWVTAEIATT